MLLIMTRHRIKTLSITFSLTSIVYCAQKLFQIVTTRLEGGFMANK